MALETLSRPISPSVSATRAPTLNGAARLVNRPTLIEHGAFRFVVLDAPTDANLPAYLEFLKKRGVTVVVRACEPSYSTGPLEREGIRVVELPFPDGEPPSEDVINRWLTLVQSEFPELASHSRNASAVTSASSASSSPTTPASLDEKGKEEERDKDCDPPDAGNAIAVHCVAGLGRAPVLVAVALIELGMGPLDAIAFIRKRRRGAINARQIKFLESYRPRLSGNSCKCIIM